MSRGAIVEVVRSAVILGGILLGVMLGGACGAAVVRDQQRQPTVQAQTPVPSPTMVPEPILPGLPTPRNVGAPESVGWVARPAAETHALKEWRLEDGVRCYWVVGPALACVVVPSTPTRGPQ